FLFSLAVVPMVMALLWREVPMHWLLAWLVLQVIVSIGGFLLFYFFQGQSSTPTRPNLWRQTFLLTCLVSGLGWGLLALSFDPTWHPAKQITLILLLLSIATTNSWLLVAHRLVALSYSIVAGLPITVWLITSPDLDYQLAGLLIAGLGLVYGLWYLPHAYHNLLRSLQQDEQAKKLTWERDALARQAKNDLLTGLPNRRALEEHLARALSRCANNQKFLLVLALDSFDFKQINATRSYATGDRVLQQLADRLRETLSASDFVARIGGAEFIVVYESIEHLEEIKPLLERLHEAVTVPFEIGEQPLQLDAHAGLAIYPLLEVSGVSELLHAAEQALDQAQKSPDKTALWWKIQVSDPTDTVPIMGQILTHQGHRPRIYGPDAADLLNDVQSVCATTTQRFIRALHEDLFKRLQVQSILSLFNTEEWQQHDTYLRRHMAMLTDLNLDQTRHVEYSIKAGRRHETTGIQEAWVDEAYATWEQIFVQHPGHLSLAVQLARSVIKKRFAADLEYQRAGREEIHLEWEKVAAEIDNLAWRSRHYVDLVEGTVTVLGNLQEVVAVTQMRSDEHSVLRYEAVSDVFAAGEHDLSNTQLIPCIHVDVDHPREDCPAGRAWRSGHIERSPSVNLDPHLEVWKSLAKQRGIRSLVAIPLFAGGQVRSILTLYLAYYGGFTGSERQKLLERIQRMLSMGMEQYLRTGKLPGLQYLEDRLRYIHLLDEGRLVMLYQPILGLHNGKLAKVEALARLRRNDEWLSPAQFLPLFGKDELFALYRKGLEQALQTLRTWAGQGLKPDLSINLPPQGLDDSRYIDVTRQLLVSLPIPERQQLILELLETEDLNIYSHSGEMFMAWQELGVSFAEDDLGSGYSSLARLRSIPFQFVKVDQTLVKNFEKEPFKVLHLIEQLISLAHSMGTMIVIEGLESEGLVEMATIFGADFGQGYAIAKPMPADALPEWTKNHISWHLDRTRPATLPGLLALFLQNEKRVTEMQDWPSIARILVREGIHAEWFSGLNVPADPSLQAAFHTL
ncbi:MAG TPA: EAL domain-containing protein, partial [Mizugakiibacter sp.]|nr:EAL domain-containing protein [Mizugakiibacter sp.]